IDEKNSKKNLWKKIILVFCFVALPVPGTGTYTGTALAILLGLNPLISIACVTLGNIVAGVIIMTICTIFPQFSTILFYIFIALILMLLIYKLIVHFVNKKNEQKNEQNK
ncbi:MAG: small multi-drug export protein, partial [Christensenellales bacterium]